MAFSRNLQINQDNFLPIGFISKMIPSSIGKSNLHYSSTLSWEKNSSISWVINSSLFIHKMPSIRLTFLNANQPCSQKTSTVEKIHTSHKLTIKLTIWQPLLSNLTMEMFFIWLLYYSKNSKIKSSFMTCIQEHNSQNPSWWEKIGKEKSNQSNFLDTIWLSYWDIWRLSFSMIWKPVMIIKIKYANKLTELIPWQWINWESNISHLSKFTQAISIHMCYLSITLIALLFWT